MTTNPKPGTLPWDLDDVDGVDGTTILVVDMHLSRSHLVDRIDDAVDFDLEPAAGGKNLSSIDLARLYAAVSDDERDPYFLTSRHRKGRLTRLLGDELGFYATDAQSEPVKEQVIQIWLALATGDVADRMPTLPHQSTIDIDLAEQGNGPRTRPARSPAAD